MEIKRDEYLDRLIVRKHNGFIKVITGIRRSGKTYLLNTLFYNHLKEKGIADDHITLLLGIHAFLRCQANTETHMQGC